jgi:hypothetical protein
MSDKQQPCDDPANCGCDGLAAKKPKVRCKLCNCEGVDNTVLCREHMEGYKFAAELLSSTKHVTQAKLLMRTIKQKED